MQNNSMPELNHPMINLMSGNMIGVPDMISNALPATLPRMNFTDGVFSMIFGTYKRRKMEEATEYEKRIAQNCRDAVVAKFDAILQAVTFNEKFKDAMGEFEYRKAMRALAIQKEQAQLYLLQAQAQTAGFEAKLTELDYNTRLEQQKEMKGGG